MARLHDIQRQFHHIVNWYLFNSIQINMTRQKSANVSQTL